MASGVSLLKIRLEAEDAASKVISGVGKSLDSLNTSSSAFKRAADASKMFALALGGIGAGVAAVGTLALKAGSEAEQAQTSFEVLLGSAEKAQQFIAGMRQFANATPFEFMDISRASQTLLAFGMDAESVMPTIQNLGDVSLGNKERFQQLALAFGQVQANGRLMGQEVLQMVNAGFNPLQVISEKTGISMGELKKKMEQGAIGADMVAEAFKAATAEGGRFHDGMKKQSETLAGKWSTFTDAVNNQLIALGQKFVPVLKVVVTWMTNFVNNIDQVTKYLSEHRTMLLIVAGALTGLLIPAFIAIATTLITTTIPAIIATAIAFAPYVIGGAVVGAVVAGIIWLANNWGKAMSFIGEAMNSFGSALSSIFAQIKGIVYGFFSPFAKAINWATGAVKGFINALWGLVKNTPLGKIAEQIGGEVGNGINSLMSMVGDVKQSAQSVVNDMTSSASEALSGLQNAAGGAFQAVQMKIGEVSASVASAFNTVGTSSAEAAATAGANAGDFAAKFQDATGKAGKAGEKLKEDFKKYTETVQKFADDVEAEMNTVAQKIGEIMGSLRENDSEYSKQQQENRMSYAQAYVDQENKIKDLKDQLRDTEDSDDRVDLQNKIKKEQTTLNSFKDLYTTYQKEIEYLHAEAQKSELQRTVESIKTKEWQQMAEYSATKEKLLKELTAEITKYETLKELQSQGLVAQQNFLNSSEKMTSDSINREIDRYNALAQAIARAKAGQTSGKISGVNSSTKNVASLTESVMAASKSATSSTLQAALNNVLGLASGGIVTRPTFAMVGEAGTEAVIPLNRLGSSGLGSVIINITGTFLSETAAEEVGDMIIDKFLNQRR